MNGFFQTRLEHADPELYESISNELLRQKQQVELIASENIVSKASQTTRYHA